MNSCTGGEHDAGTRAHATFTRRPGHQRCEGFTPQLSCARRLHKGKLERREGVERGGRGTGWDTASRRLGNHTIRKTKHNTTRRDASLHSVSSHPIPFSLQAIPVHSIAFHSIPLHAISISCQPFPVQSDTQTSMATKPITSLFKPSVQKSLTCPKCQSARGSGWDPVSRRHGGSESTTRGKERDGRKGGSVLRFLCFARSPGDAL